MRKRILIVALFLVIMLLVSLRLDNQASVQIKLPSNSAVLPESHGGSDISSKTAPPMWEPLESSGPTLMQLARMGDRSAADRLFAESRQCLKAGRMKSFFKGVDYATWLVNNQKLLESMDQSRRNLVMSQVEANIHLVETSSRLCANADTGLSEGQIYGIAFAAARLGNGDATACLLSAPYDPPKMTPAQSDAFDAEAMALGQRALDHGNWNAVLAMQHVYSAVGAEGQLPPVSHINHAYLLKVVSLQLRGTPPTSSQLLPLEREVAAVEATVTPAEKFAAERWADDMYARVFFASGPAPGPESVACDY
jgi:hypothetical protein